MDSLGLEYSDYKEDLLKFHKQKLISYFGEEIYNKSLDLLEFIENKDKDFEDLDDIKNYEKDLFGGVTTEKKDKFQNITYELKKKGYL